MNKHPVALALALAFAVSPLLLGCDSTSNLTEQQHIERAKDFDDKGDVVASILELKNAIQKNPDSAQARLLLGQAYLKEGRGAEAEKELSQAAKLGVGSETVKLQLGKALLLMGEYKRVLDEVVVTDSTTAQNRAALLRLRGDALTSLRKFDEGCELYKESITADPKHMEAYWGLANCAVQRRDLGTARAMIDAAIKADSTYPGNWVMLGDFERLNNNPRAAAEAYTAALRLNPAKPVKLDALLGRGLAFVATGKLDEVRSDLEALKKTDTNFYGTNFLKATLHYTKGETDLALNSVQKALNSNPGFRPAQLLYAVLQYDKKSYQQAARVLSNYLRQAPGHLEARKLLAATHLKLKEPERTLELLKPYIAAGKADAQILALAGEVYLQEDDPGSARTLFEKAAELVPTNATLRAKVGLSDLAAGQGADAVRELQASSALSAKYFQADIALAMHFVQEGQFDKALAAIAVLEKKLPDSPGTYNLKGLAYMGKKDYPQARKNFERALALNPTLVSAAVNLGRLDVQEKNLPAARRRLQGILDKDSKNVHAMVALADLARLENNEAQYLAWLEKAARAKPTAFRPRSLMAEYYLGKGDPQKALSIAREATAGKTDSLEALDLLGRIQLAAGEKENALSTFTKLANIAPKSARAHYNLARAHAAKGDEKSTRRELREALTLDSGYSDAAIALSRLEVRTGNHAEALESARELQGRMPSSPAGFELEGDAWMAVGKYRDAVQSYQKALDVQKLSDLAIKLHLAQARSGNLGAADAFLLDWLQARPGDSVARTYLAVSYGDRKQNVRAIEQYEFLLKASPNSAILLNNLAILYQRERNPRALPTAEQAYKLQPKNPAIADTLGWILVEQGKVARGLELLDKAHKAAPRVPEFRYHYAAALARSGDTARARAELKSLLAKAGPFGERAAAEDLLARLK